MATLNNTELAGNSTLVSAPLAVIVSEGEYGKTVKRYQADNVYHAMNSRSRDMSLTRSSRTRGSGERKRTQSPPEPG